MQDDVTDWVMDQLDEWDVDVSALPISMPSPKEWHQFWGLVRHAFDAESLDELAWLRPYAESAVSILEKQDQGREYAAWLRQRMDYFFMAEQFMRTTPSPPPSQVPGAQVPGAQVPGARVPGARVPPSQTPVVRSPGKILPPASPPKARRTSTPAKLAPDVEDWRARLSGRPAPANAKKYVPSLKSIFRKEGVPEQLVWLAEVESTFRPEARSPVGAVGLYQFMPATAERFGLAIKPRDERLHPEKNARAAAQYLNLLHRRFNSWPLALAAYNAGEGRVGRLMRKHNATAFEGIAGHLPAETRMYVPKVRAVVMVREGVDINQL